MVVAAPLDWLQVLADATRVRLLCLLSESELSVSELCSITQLPQSTVSRHLKVLADDAWIDSRRDGTNHFYRVDVSLWDDARKSLWEWVANQLQGPGRELDQRRLASVLSARSRSEAFFSSAAEQWDRLRVDLFGQHFDAFSLAAALPSESVVGELGCGSAPLSQRVAPFVKKVYAIDNSSAMLAAAASQLNIFPNIQLYKASLDALPIETHTLDVAWLTHVLAYLPEPIVVLREVARVMKQAGRLIVMDLLPHDRTVYRQEMAHLRLGVSQSELSTWMQAAGLRLTNFFALPPDPQAKGPAMFSAVAARAE